jgi:hypothetical protein
VEEFFLSDERAGPQCTQTVGDQWECIPFWEIRCPQSSNGSTNSQLPWPVVYWIIPSTCGVPGAINRNMFYINISTIFKIYFDIMCHVLTKMKNETQIFKIKTQFCSANSKKANTKTKSQTQTILSDRNHHSIVSESQKQCLCTAIHKLFGTSTNIFRQESVHFMP